MNLNLDENKQPPTTTFPPETCVSYRKEPSTELEALIQIRDAIEALRYRELWSGPEFNSHSILPWFILGVAVGLVLQEALRLVAS